jgi:hypothetical protein
VDSITLASAFATIIGLVCNFRQEQASEASLTTDDFFQWLNDHKHEIIRHQIQGNAELLNGIAGLLQANRETLIERFDRINLLLAQLLSKVDGFRPLVHSIYPTVEFSEQAVGILRIFVESGGKELALFHVSNGLLLQVVGVTGFENLEPRFLEDDLDTLCKHGFVTRGLQDSTVQYFRLTRQGVGFIEYVSSLDKSL